MINISTPNEALINMEELKLSRPPFDSSLVATKVINRTTTDTEIILYLTDIINQ